MVLSLKRLIHWSSLSLKRRDQRKEEREPEIERGMEGGREREGGRDRERERDHKGTLELGPDEL